MNDQESGKGLSVGRQPNFTAPVTALKKEEQASPSATKEGTTYLCVQCVKLEITVYWSFSRNLLTIILINFVL